MVGEESQDPKKVPADGPGAGSESTDADESGHHSSSYGKPRGGSPSGSAGPSEDKGKQRAGGEDQAGTSPSESSESADESADVKK